MQKSKIRQTAKASAVKTKAASQPGQNANQNSRAQNGQTHQADLIESAVGQINAMAITLKQTAQQAQSLALSGEETASSVNEMVASIEQVTSSLPLATLIKIEGADHGFKIPRQDSLPVLAMHIKGWMDKNEVR